MTFRHLPGARTARGIRLAVAALACLLAVPAAAAPAWDMSGRVDLDSMVDLSRSGAPRSGTSELWQWGGTLDAGRAWGWHGISLDVGAQAVHASGDSAMGSAAVQGPSNEWASDFARIIALDVTARLPHATLRAGILDLNQYFESSDQAALLHNSSFGMAPNFTANVATPTFPVPGAAAMMRTSPARHWIVRAGVWQGAPPVHAGGFSHGSLWIGEVERQAAGDRADVKLGLWHARGTHPEVTGAYLVGDTRWRSSAHRWGAFVLAGSTPAAATEIGTFIAAGVRVHAPLSGRGDDQLSLGVSRATIAAARPETVVEVVYRWRLGDGADLEPDLQYIAQSGGGPTSAWVGGMRLHIGF